MHFTNLLTDSGLKFPSVSTPLAFGGFFAALNRVPAGTDVDLLVRGWVSNVLVHSCQTCTDLLLGRCFNSNRGDVGFHPGLWVGSRQQPKPILPVCFLPKQEHYKPCDSRSIWVGVYIRN
jgi:hypothetical protein